MEYFRAVQEGRSRAQRALEFLQEVVGPCSPALFLKMGAEEWTPVGDENLYGLVEGAGETAKIVVCDQDGNVKAMSGWLTADAVSGHASELQSRGIARFSGKLNLPI